MKGFLVWLVRAVYVLLILWLLSLLFRPMPVYAGSTTLFTSRYSFIMADEQEVKTDEEETSEEEVLEETDDAEEDGPVEDEEEVA